MLNMKRRWMIFAIVTIAVLVTLSLWPTDRIAFAAYSQWINVIGLTWFGPPLLFLIPGTLAWVGLGEPDRTARNVLLGLATVTFCLCLLMMWFIKDAIQPYCGFWQGCI
jgi:hypothetical protein